MSWTTESTLKFTVATLFCVQGKLFAQEYFTIGCNLSISSPPACQPPSLLTLTQRLAAQFILNWSTQQYSSRGTCLLPAVPQTPSQDEHTPQNLNRYNTPSFLSVSLWHGEASANSQHVEQDIQNRSTVIIPFIILFFLIESGHQALPFTNNRCNFLLRETT